MSSEKRKIAYIDGKPYEIGSNHTSILKFVRSYVGEKKVPTLCDDPNLAPYGACRVRADEDALVLVLSGQPIDEPIASYGPFVMNTDEEIMQAVKDFQSGKFGYLD